MVADAQLLNWIVQGGSFALVVAGCVYVAKVLIPRTIAAFDLQQSKFDAILERQEKRHEREMEKRDSVLERLVASIDALADRVGKLEERS